MEKKFIERKTRYFDPDDEYGLGSWYSNGSVDKIRMEVQSRQPQVFWDEYDYFRLAIKMSVPQFTVDQKDYIRRAFIAKNLTPNKINNKIDWEAWFCYFHECHARGLICSYEDIARLADRSVITVKQKFNLIYKGLEDD